MAVLLVAILLCNPSASKVTPSPPSAPHPRRYTVASEADAFSSSSSATAAAPITRADVFERFPPPLPVSSASSLLLLVGLTLGARLAACLVLGRRMRRLLLTQQQDVERGPAAAAAPAPAKRGAPPASSRTARVAPKGLLSADSAAESYAAAELAERSSGRAVADRV